MPSQSQSPLELYFWTTPNGQKISIFLEEVAANYILHMIHIGRGDQHQPHFLKISPNNKIPALVDPQGPDGAPISIFESGAILIYLAQKFKAFYPVPLRERLQVDQWLFWQVGGFGPMLGQNHHFRLYADEKIPYAMDRYLQETHRLYGVLDQQLANQTYVAGDYSIADMAILPWALGWEAQGMQLPDAFPNVHRWLTQVTARPAVIRGLAAGKAQAEAMREA